MYFKKLHPHQHRVKSWAKREMKRRRGAILKDKLRPGRDHELREYHLEKGGQRKFERRMKAARDSAA